MLIKFSTTPPVSTEHRFLTVNGDQVTTEQVRLPYDVEMACSRLLAAGLPERFAEYLRTGGNVSDHI